MAYVGYVGWALTAEDEDRRYTGRLGVQAGFERFRRIASVTMNNDAAALILLCVITRGTLGLDLSLRDGVLIGGALGVAGVAAKVWAARTLGGKGYYWYDFFIPPDNAEHKSNGAYRYLSNPMYTVGYLQCYGLAVLLQSWPGLLISLFDQLAILAFYLIVEKPHYQRIYGKERSLVDA